jgi:hypothetical protein
MATGVQKKAFDNADSVRTPEMTRIESVTFGPVTAARFTMRSGWKWSEHIRPVVGTDTCQSRHVGAVVSGKLHISHTDGTEVEVGPGDAYVIDPGHDAWVVGDEDFVTFEFETDTAAGFAAPSA